MLRFLQQLLVVIGLFLLSNRTLYAGVGPENLVLVINSRSLASVTLANHYQALRGIPPSHVIYLSLDPAEATIDINSFRSKIFEPIMRAMQTRGIAEQIDLVVYSAGFPTAVDIRADLPPQANLGAVQPYAALTGLTYLYAPVMQKNAGAYLQPTINFYYRPVTAQGQSQPTRGFHAWYGWQNDGQVLESGGARYLLSAMLRVVEPTPTGLAEALTGLQVNAKADGKTPSGTIYFSDHGDVRAKTRAPLFTTAVEQLTKLEVSAKIISARFPAGKKDILGATLGFSGASEVTSDVRIVPGAIVENLTSYGAKFNSGHGQPVLTAFMKLGAAGSSGTVDEPLAMPAKFPNPFLHVHYARGCTLVEAYYQAVQSPWQLLVVGDPLCAPWADLPEVAAPSELNYSRDLIGVIKIKPSASSRQGPVERFELFVDGARVARCSAGEVLQLDTTQHSDGLHEVRVVAIGNGLIESQGRWSTVLNFGNHGRKLTLSVTPVRVKAGEPFTIRAQGTNCKSLVLYCNGRIVSNQDGDQLVRQQTTASTDKEPGLGTGPVTWRVIGLGDKGPSSHVLSAPVTVTIDP